MAPKCATGTVKPPLFHRKRAGARIPSPCAAMMPLDGKSVKTFQAAFLQTRSFMTGLLIGLALVVPFLR